jgi:hypothetical protein
MEELTRVFPIAGESFVATSCSLFPACSFTLCSEDLSGQDSILHSLGPFLNLTRLSMVKVHDLVSEV